MNSRLVELALKKQRLQISSATLREQWTAQAAGLEPFCAGIDGLRSGAAWLRRHPAVVVAATVALVVARPRAVFRWTRRAFVAWQAWRRTRGWFAGRLGAQ